MSQKEAAVQRLEQLQQQYQTQVEENRRRLVELGPDRVLLVLLDIGKNVHWFCARTAAAQELVAPQRVSSGHSGLQQVLQQIEHLMAQHQPAHVILGHEPSGVYHLSWSHALHHHFQAHLHGSAAPSMEYRFFNPYQVKLARQLITGRFRKTDARDLLGMADLVERGLGQPAFFPSQHEWLIRQHVRFYRAQSRALHYLDQALRRQIDVLWPQAVVHLKRFRAAHPHLTEPTPIVRGNPLQTQRLRLLLQYCPDPHQMAALSDEDLLDLYRSHGLRAGPVLLKILRAWQQNAVLLPPQQTPLLASQLQLTLQQYLATETLIQDTYGQLLPLLPHTPARHLVAIPGLTEWQAVAYLAGLGAADRFHTPAQVWSLAGFDPIQDDTGDSLDRFGHLSKRGDPAFRDTLYRMGYQVAQYYPPVTLTFLAAFERSWSETPATIHAAHRVNRICFHLIQHDEPFQNLSTPQQCQQALSGWQRFLKRKKKSRPRKRPASKGAASAPPS